MCVTTLLDYRRSYNLIINVNSINQTSTLHSSHFFPSLQYTNFFFKAFWCNLLYYWSFTCFSSCSAFSSIICKIRYVQHADPSLFVCPSGIKLNWGLGNFPHCTFLEFPFGNRNPLFIVVVSFSLHSPMI